MYKLLYRLKDLKVILAILLILTWVIGGLIVFLYYKGNISVIKQKDAKIEELSAHIKQLGDLTPAYRTRAAVPSNKKIEESDLEQIYVPQNISANVITNIEELIGNYYKIDVSQHTIVSKDMIDVNETTDDLRYLDVVTHITPIGLQVGDYIDVRISYPLGQDYIVLNHKRVEEINSEVLKLKVNEEDIHKYNSILIDSFIYPGSQIYALEYVQGGVQKPAESYYPMSKDVLAIAQKDPNLLSAIKTDIIQRRNALEIGIDSIKTPEAKLKQQEALEELLDGKRLEYAKLINTAKNGGTNPQAQQQPQQQAQPQQTQPQAQEQQQTTQQQDKKTK